MQYMQNRKSPVPNYSTSIHNLEAQIGQLSNTFLDKSQRNLLSNMVTNPKEHVKAISLRNGRIIKYS